MLNENEMIEILKARMVQNKDYCTILEVPFHDTIEVNLDEINPIVSQMILLQSPNCKTVKIGMFSRKGITCLTYNAWEGSPDGFPMIPVVI